MGNITDITAVFVSTIAGLVPDLEPAITFREVHYQMRLGDPKRPPLQSPSKTTRTFHVLPRWDPNLASDLRTGAGNPYWRQSIQIEVLYQIPPADNGVRRLFNLVSTDVPILYQALYQAALGLDVVQRHVDLPDSEPPLTVVLESANTFLLTMVPGIFYTRDSAP